MRKVQAGTFLVSAEESLIAAAPSSVSGSTAHPGVVSVGLGLAVEGRVQGERRRWTRLGLSLQLQGDFSREGLYVGRPPPGRWVLHST